MRTIFYLRSGTRISRSRVRAARLAYANAKRTGNLGNILKMSIQPTMADAFEKMRDEDFTDWSGAYTWKKLTLQ